MKSFDQILAPISGDLQSYRAFYKKALTGGNVKGLDFINYLIKSEGKSIRPVLLFFAARLHGELTEQSIASAAILELTHTASLIHDDIVDEAFQRRSRLSINALWRSHKAVLIGDYVVARAMYTAAESGYVSVLTDISMVIESMSLGEIEQSDLALKMEVNEQSYFEIIGRKTASLMSCAARLGAKSNTNDKESIEHMNRFGELLGIIFQIKDDILDFMGGASGKSKCNDLKEQKITLPLIYALKKADHKDKNNILKLLRERDEKSNYISKILNFVEEQGGIVSAEKRMLQYAQDAKEILNHYPSSVYKQSLIDLIDYICERDR